MTSMDDAHLRRRAPRLDPVHASRRCLLVFSLALIVASGLRRITDEDFPRYFVDLIAGQPTPADPMRGFLFEGLLGDLIGYCFAWTHRDASTIAGAWWAAGSIALSWSATHVCRSRRISVETACVLLIATHVIDTLLLWIGKLDAFLLAALVLTAHPDRKTSAAGNVVAALLHPPIAILSTVGTTLAMDLDEGKPHRFNLFIVVAAASLDLLAFGYLFPDMRGRTGFMQAQLQHLLIEGVNDGVPALLAGFAAPLALAYLLVGQPEVGRSRTSVLIGCWFVLVALLTSFLIRDHTRVLCLVTFVPLVILMSSLVERGDAQPSLSPSRFLLCILVIRMAIPHMDGSGPEMFRWGIVTRLLGPS